MHNYIHKIGINYLNKNSLNHLFLNRWCFFGSVFFLSFVLKCFIIIYSEDAKLGWDEVLYMKHAGAIYNFIINFDLSQLYENYFLLNKDAVRFFPPGSPFGYAIFRLLTGDALLGARIYNSILISIGIASSATIFLTLTRQKILSILLLFLMLVSMEHNAYSIFLWTEGVQFGLLSLIILVSLRYLSVKRSLIISILLMWMVLAHASSLAIVVAVFIYLVFFKLKKHVWVYKLKISFILLVPTLTAVIALAVFYKPVIGEFVLITSESIPMKSLRNPPSSYHDTWTKIRSKSNETGMSLSEASSSIASDFLATKDLSFIVNRGWDTLKSSMKADTFPQRHFNAGKWPFLSSDSFLFFERMHEVYYFLVYVGLALFVFSGRCNRLSFLVSFIFSLKVVVMFFTGVAMTRYFSAFFMVIFPLSFYGYYVTFYRLYYRNDYLKMAKYLVWALFLGSFVL